MTADTTTSIKLSLPKEATPLLLMQRSGYRSGMLKTIQKAVLFPVTKNFRRKVVRSVFLPLESAFRHAAIERAYRTDLQEVFRTFADHLPKGATRVLDIGAGMGGINCFTHHALDSKPEIWLLDKGGEAGTWNSGFHQDAATFSHYNSFDMARSVLELGGVPSDKVHCIDINTDEFPFDRKFDVIYSFLSCGFHYAVQTYSAQVARTLAPGGVVILDIRKNTIGKTELSSLFDLPVKVIFDGGHYERVVIGPKAVS